MTQVSVIIPTYNRAAMVRRAIDSALAQSYAAIEVIVVDDGSTDQTPQIVAAVSDPRVRYLRRDENRGAQVARNAGIAAATGQYLAFLDSDDEWHQEKIARQAALLDRSPDDVGLVYCGIRRIDQDGRPTHDHKPRHRGNVFEDLLLHNVIGGMSVALIRASVFHTIGPFDERLRARQDLDMWLRIARHYRVDYVPEKLVTYHVHRGRTSENKSSRLQGTLALMAKLRHDLAVRPKARAVHFFALARLYRQRNDRGRERRYLRRSLQAQFRIRTLGRYLQNWIDSALRRG